MINIFLRSQLQELPESQHFFGMWASHLPVLDLPKPQAMSFVFCTFFDVYHQIKSQNFVGLHLTFWFRIIMKYIYIYITKIPHLSKLFRSISHILFAKPHVHGWQMCRQVVAGSGTTATTTATGATTTTTTTVMTSTTGGVTLRRHGDNSQQNFSNKNRVM